MQKYSLPAQYPCILYIDLNTTISAGKVKAAVTIIYDPPVLVSSNSPRITTEKSVCSRSPYFATDHFR